MQTIEQQGFWDVEADQQKLEKAILNQLKTPASAPSSASEPVSQGFLRRIYESLCKVRVNLG